MLSAVDCGVPSIANANSYGTSCQGQCTTYQSRMTVICSRGYTAVGVSGTLTCGSDGHWTGFSCNGKMMLCNACVLIFSL